MSYTNGFNKTQVLPALVGRLGWSDTTLNAANQTSRSGRYFDDGSFHALVTVPNIKATVPSQTDWDAWFTKWQNAAVLKCLSGVFTGAETMEQAVSLYDRTSEQTQTVSNSALFCGYEIKVAKSADVCVQLNTATLLLDGDVTFNLYVFQSGKVAPIKTIAVTSVANEATEITVDEVYLKHPGTYYVGYFQSDLGVVKAIAEEVAWLPTYCFDVRSFYSTENGDDFNRVSLSYTARPYGLNLGLSSFKDYTTAIVQKASLFDEAIGLTLSAMVMEQEFFSTEWNATERQIRDTAKAAVHLELQGALPIPDSPHIEGIRVRLKKEYAAIRSQFIQPSKARVVNLCS